jgi:uncharacterized membrane protein (DUF485 family)
MDERQVEQILQNPKFKEMVSRKSKLSWTLTSLCWLYTLVSCCWSATTKNF